MSSTDGHDYTAPMSGARRKKRTDDVFTGIDYTLITFLSIMLAGILGFSGVLIWLVAGL